MSSDSRRFGEHVEKTTVRDDRRNRDSRLELALEKAYEALSRGEYHQAGCVLNDVILPEIHDLEDAKPMGVYHSKLNPDDAYEWHWPELRKFRDQPDRILQIVARGSVNPDRSVSAWAGGRKTGLEGARECIKRALASAESIVAHHGIVDDGLRNRVDGVGFQCQLGQHLQSYQMHIGDPVTAVSEQAGQLKTLFSGGTGSGKSTGAEREFQDLWLRNRDRSDIDIKCIDLVGLGEGENVDAYDIPQRQEALRDAREEMGLPADFTEDEAGAYDPETEVLVPLTPSLDDVELPYDTEAEDFVAQPFTIPASSLSEELLVAVIATRLSKQQEQTIRDVYRTVERRQTDWALKDMAEEVLRRDELSKRNKRNAISVIQSLHDLGFVRRETDEHTIDWEEILCDTDTITVFSQSLVRSEFGQLVVVAYLLDEIWHRRREFHHYPQLALLMRELWEVVPHSKREQDDDRAAAVQEAIAYRMYRLLRKNRHIQTTIIGDTQQVGDLHKAVREMFNRYVIFDGNVNAVKNVFSWTSNDRWKSFMNTLTAEAGVAGIVGMVEPAVEERRIEYLSPFQYAPPSHHHHDADRDSTGWHARVKYIDNEELRPVEWDLSVPEDLDVPTIEEWEAEEEDGEEASAKEPVEYHRAEARRRMAHGASIRKIRDAIPNNPDTGNPYSTNTIYNWCDDIDKGEAIDDADSGSSGGASASAD